jgi:hypothetical protein
MIRVEKTNSRRHFSGYDIAACFGNERPRVVDSPHLIVRRAGLRPPAWIVNHFLSQVVSAAGGIWGRTPFVDRTGHLYGTRDFPLADFAAWEHPINQWEVFTQIFGGCDTERFTAIIPTITPLGVLERMQSLISCVPGEQAAAIEGMADVIESLGWAYFPLVGECPLAMFAVRRQDVTAIEALRAMLDATREPCFQVEVR